MANGYCRKCGYSLIGLDRNRCPECGQPFDPADPRTMRPYRGLFPSRVTVLRRWLILSAILIIGSLCFQQWHQQGWAGVDFRLEANWIDMGLPFPWLTYRQVEGDSLGYALPEWEKSIPGLSLHPMAMAESTLIDLGLALLLLLLVQAIARRRRLEPKSLPRKWIALSVGAGSLAGLSEMIGVRGLVWLAVCVVIVSAAVCGVASWRARTWKSVLLISLCFSLAYWWSDRMTIFAYFSRMYSAEPAENLLAVLMVSVMVFILIAAPVAFVSRRVVARRAARAAVAEDVPAAAGRDLP